MAGQFQRVRVPFLSLLLTPRARFILSLSHSLHHHLPPSPPCSFSLLSLLFFCSYFLPRSILFLSILFLHRAPFLTSRQLPACTTPCPFYVAACCLNCVVSITKRSSNSCVWMSNARFELCDPL